MASPWAAAADEVLAGLDVAADRGLTPDEVSRRRRQYGINQLKSVRRPSAWSVLLNQLQSIVIVLLAAAALIALVLANVAEGLAILAVIALNTTIGFVTEWRATRSMEALGRLARTETVVMREGTTQRVLAEELVPGDIVLLEGGDVVTADLRLLEAAKLQANESTLTGEAMPVTKNPAELTTGTPLMERVNMLYKGSAVARGSGKGVVVGTGLVTELGRISQLVMSAEPRETPLERRLDALARRLVWIVLVIAVFIAGGGIIAGRDLYLALEVAIALSVAAIPEGLPVVATIALARGMWRMARRNALVAQLSAVETLGATSVIVTDKTGTLTENRMTVTAVELPGKSLELPAGSLPAATTAMLTELLESAVLCNNASLGSPAADASATVGDPTETALLTLARNAGIERDALVADWPELHEVPFDPETKRMATLHRADSGVRVAVKGAPETIIKLCVAERDVGTDQPLSDADRQGWLERAASLAARGLRTLAIAVASHADIDTDPFDGLILLGLVGLEDPARDGVRDAVERCNRGGVDVVMMTGDHAETALNIARDVGIVPADAGLDSVVTGDDLADLLAQLGAGDALRFRIVARATPEQKLSLVRFLQDRNRVVAMTGDGVNDAPALKQADIGIAMGLRGTAVAKESAAMVLQDDEFGTIVEAIAQGRAIFDNIRKFVVYLLSCNISEILIVGLATIAGAPLPLLPLQILFLNLVTDVFPALALGVGEGSRVLMRQPPRPAGEPVLTRWHWLMILQHAAIMSGAVLAAMAVAIFGLGFDAAGAVTVSFCTLAFAQLWHVFNMRSRPRAIFRNEITRNPWIWGAIILCVLLVLAVVYIPFLASLLSLGAPGPSGWLTILGMSVIPLLVPHAWPRQVSQIEKGCQSSRC